MDRVCVALGSGSDPIPRPINLSKWVIGLWVIECELLDLDLFGRRENNREKENERERERNERGTD